MRTRSVNWVRNVILGALAVVVAAPFVLRPRKAVEVAERTLIVVTPHNEAIRHEIGVGFARWYLARTGHTVLIDWRTIGGASETVRYLKAGYAAAFELDWRRRHGGHWDPTLGVAAMDSSISLPADPTEDTPAQAARRAFLASDVGVGLDVFFGGGSFEFVREARAGRLVDAGMRQRRPEWFNDSVLPDRWAGVDMQDAGGRWYGTVLSSFGLLANLDSLQRLGVDRVERWRDLTRPELLGEVAMTDPTRSSSSAAAYEMILQQEMWRRLHALAEVEPDLAKREARAVREGWLEGLRLLQLAAANARYFSDSSQKPPNDVAQGDAAVGVCIDMFGRFEEDVTERREGRARVRFVEPIGGSAYTADPVALLRGAPHRELACDFIEYTLSMEGQRLWDQEVGTPGGPGRFALRRMPIRRDYYQSAELRKLSSDPDVDPFSAPEQLEYRPEWTGRVFRELAFIIRVVGQDSHEELQEAWREVVAKGCPEHLVAQLGDLSAVNYDRALGEIHRRLSSPDKADSMRMAKELTEHFRAQYRAVETAARNLPSR